MDPIDFGGRSEVKVTIGTIGIYGKKLVNTIETKPLCASSSNLANILAIARGWTLLILEVRVTIDMYDNKLVNMIETKLLCVSYIIKLGRLVIHSERMDPINHGERMNSIDF